MAAQSAYVAEAAKWRANYEMNLKAPDGWLAVAGLFWLHEGANSAGSDPKSDIVLPAPAPSHAGTFVLARGKVSFGGKELRSDVDEDVARIGDLTLTVIERDGRMGVRMRDPNAETRRRFTGSTWFPADEAWRVRAQWVTYPKAKKIAITNILGMTDEEDSPGYAEFTLANKKIRLEPVIDEKQLFFMFKDATTGKTTYPAGRFLYAPIPSGSEVVLDFNQAHNPPCAFTAFATCPLPPRQNTITAAVEAGEKTYGHH